MPTSRPVARCSTPPWKRPMPRSNRCCSDLRIRSASTFSGSHSREPMGASVSSRLSRYATSSTNLSGGTPCQRTNCSRRRASTPRPALRPVCPGPRRRRRDGCGSRAAGAWRPSRRRTRRRPAARGRSRPVRRLRPIVAGPARGVRVQGAADTVPAMVRVHEQIGGRVVEVVVAAASPGPGSRPARRRADPGHARWRDRGTASGSSERKNGKVTYGMSGVATRAAARSISYACRIAVSSVSPNGTTSICMAARVLAQPVRRDRFIRENLVGRTRAQRLRHWVVGPLGDCRQARRWGLVRRRVLPRRASCRP